MFKVCTLLLVIAFCACSDPRYKVAGVRWPADEVNPPYTSPNTSPTFLHEVDAKKADLHGKTITLRGRLVYEYDDVAIYPIHDHGRLKPVWIHLDQDESELHDFLLENDQALVTIVGVLDTADLFDDSQYSSAIKDILSVDVSHVLAKR